RSRERDAIATQHRDSSSGLRSCRGHVYLRLSVWIGRCRPYYPLFLLSLLCSKFVPDTVGLYGTFDLERRWKAAQWLPIVLPSCPRSLSAPAPGRFWQSNLAFRNPSPFAATDPVIRHWPDRC